MYCPIFSILPYLTLYKGVSIGTAEPNPSFVYLQKKRDCEVRAEENDAVPLALWDFVASPAFCCLFFSVIHGSLLLSSWTINFFRQRKYTQKVPVNNTIRVSLPFYKFNFYLFLNQENGMPNTYVHDTKDLSHAEEEKKPSKLPRFSLWVRCFFLTSMNFSCFACKFPSLYIYICVCMLTYSDRGM